MRANKPRKSRIIAAAIVAVMALAAMAGVRLPHDFRSEQILLCPDKHYFPAGDTIMLQGIVTCNATPHLLPYSRYVIIELITPDTILPRLDWQIFLNFPTKLRLGIAMFRFFVTFVYTKSFYN